MTESSISSVIETFVDCEKKVIIKQRWSTIPPILTKKNNDFFEQRIDHDI
jgi:hypothetical protein